MKIAKRISVVFAVALCVFVTSAFTGGCSFFDSLFRDKSEEVLPHLITAAESESNPVRRVDSLEHTKGFETVSTGDQFDELVQMLYDGCKPDFRKAQPVVKQVYDKAIDVLNRYIKNDFSDYERVHAIHDWLSYYVKYDFELLDNADTANSNNSSFRPDGVFLRNKAVCDGFSKAFALLCGIEQIKATRILGKFTDDSGKDINHAWNKVCLYDKWYNVDTTMDSFHIELEAGKREDIINHGYYLLSDYDMSVAYAGRHTQTGYVPEDVDYPCTETYDFHGKTDLGIGNMKMTVTSQAELDAVFDAIKQANGKIGKIELKLDFPQYDKINLNRDDAYLSQIRAAYSKISDCDFRFDAANHIYPYYRYPRGVFVFLIYK